MCVVRSASVCLRGVHVHSQLPLSLRPVASLCSVSEILTCLLPNNRDRRALVRQTLWVSPSQFYERYFVATLHPVHAKTPSHGQDHIWAYWLDAFSQSLALYTKQHDMIRVPVVVVLVL